MDTPSVTLRCPACGQDLRVVLAPAPPTQWFSCPHCRNPVPVVVPRDPAPLYSWEVYPGLYPALPRPRPPRWRPRRVATVALAGVFVLALTFGGVLAYEGVLAAAPASYVVSGTVATEAAGGAAVPAAGARVALTEDSGATLVRTTAADGSFVFGGVPAGGIALNVSFPGYAPVEVETFASPVYNAGTQGISVVLVAGGAGGGSTLALSAFPSLESFLATVGGGAVLLGLVAGVAAAATVLTVRKDRPAVGVVGGGAGLLAPVALYLLGLAPVFPLLLVASGLLASLGSFALTIRSIALYQTGAAAGSG